MIHGIDVSHHQRPGSLNWSIVARSQSFVFVRATYGVAPDRHFDEHYANARAAGLRCGAYHFLRPRQNVVNQLDAFCRQFDLQQPGDSALPPALDVERNIKNDGDFTPDRYLGPVQLAIEALLVRYGSVFLYTSQHDWGLLGNPDCISLPGVYLWVAHYPRNYTEHSKPATPLNLPWTIWQYRGGEKKDRDGRLIIPGGRVEGAGNQDIDLNRFDGSLDELPTLGTPSKPMNVIDREAVLDQVALTLDEQKNEFFDDGEGTERS